jgi:hypothetical protein
MATPNVAQKAEIYETLSALNLAFGAIVEHLQTIRQSRIVSSRYATVLQGLTKELQSEINVELLEKMNHIELRDWARYGKVRIKWEKYLRGPEPKRKKTSR